MESFMLNFNFGEFWRSSTGLNGLDLLQCQHQGVSLLTHPFQHDLVISFEKSKVEKSQIHEISLNVKNKEYRDIAISCGAKVKSQSPRKSPPLLGASSSSAAAPVPSGNSRDRREKDEKRRKDKRSKEEIGDGGGSGKPKKAGMSMNKVTKQKSRESQSHDFQIF